uniref:Tubbylike protein putative n=1 Tax=Albugo laibachii Nc14 TaxID=890382 RepID=F0WNX0_9STRA|nr:tubbylike protein putative [Albugo laibachii Nc14]|eukprot:CCA23013.1 tubbylike protein putative [Albugo laibachii Nc14]
MRDTRTMEGAPHVSEDNSQHSSSITTVIVPDTAAGTPEFSFSQNAISDPETTGVNLLRQYEEALTSAISPHIRNLSRKRTNSRFGRAFSFQRNGSAHPENVDTHVAVSSPRPMQSAVIHHSPRAFEDVRPDLATFSPRRRAMTNEALSPALIHEVKMTFDEEKKECDDDEDKADSLSVGSRGRNGSKSKAESSFSEERAFSNAEMEGCLICMDDFSTRRKAYPLPCLGQCTGALVHYRCIMAWLGQSGSCPLCRGICDPLVLQPLQKLELQDLDRTALHPIPLDAGIIRCYVKQVYRGLFKQYGYELYLQAQAGTQDEDRFLLAARRQLRSNMTANYTIFTDKNCIKRIGRMGSNFLGTCFTMYDNGRDPQKIAKIQDAVTEEAVQNVFQIREELGCITYEPNRTSIGPRKMRVVIPSVDENSSSKIVRPMSRQDRLVHRLQSGDYRDLMRFSNREPVFREDLGAYCLDFGGRVSMASVKNFQLINSEDPSMGNILQFGRVADDMFTMDFQWPLSPFQAFAACLSSCDTKLACV